MPETAESNSQNKIPRLTQPGDPVELESLDMQKIADHRYESPRSDSRRPTAVLRGA
jgi:hypothetical protein